MEIVPSGRGHRRWLAVERGEIDGVCGWDWSSFKSQKFNRLLDNRAYGFIQVSMEPHPE